MSFSLDTNDFLRFAPIAKKLANKKGSLKEVKIGVENPKSSFYCLFGNILYSFESENDPNSLNNLYFLEGSTCKIMTNSETPTLAITLVGGKKLSLTSNTSDKEELQEWMDVIELNKFVQITRKLDDFESNLLQLQHKTEQNELVHLEYDKTISDLQKQIKDLTTQNKDQELSIAELTKDKNILSKRLKEIETERLLLLKSRGVTPKTTPLWALNDLNSRKGILSEPLAKCKMWVGSWNLSGKEPFMNIPSQKATTLLIPFVPSGYDLYVLGVQESPSESIYDCFDSLLFAEGCQRLTLDYSHVLLQTVNDDGSNPSGNRDPNADPTKLFVKGESKFNGIVIYVRTSLVSDVKLLAMTTYNCAGISSSSASSTSSSSSRIQGAVAVAISLLGRNLVFINSQFNHKSNDLRREQYQLLMTHLGSSLAEVGYHLNEQFHHILWLGDFCYKLVDVSGNDMPLETVTSMLEDPRCIRTLFETHDQLNQEKKLHNIFYGYREPVPFPNFYPTYKKIENHPPVNYSKPDWVKNTYRFQVKDSFFKGGKTKEFIPQFSDRILFYSMNDLVEDLLPESLPSEMYILRESDDKSSTVTARPNNNNAHPISALTSSLSNSTLDTKGQQQQLSVQLDNYRSMNDGEALTASDHAPVCCTFLLRLRHDHSHLIEAKAKLSAVHGDINDVLSALSNENPQAKATTTAEVAKSPSKKSYLLKDDPYSTPTKKTSSRRSVDSDDNEENNNAVQPMTPITPFNAFSLLPHGVYHVKITDMKLIWGINEEHPVNIQILFPAPYEVSWTFFIFISFILIYFLFHFSKKAFGGEKFAEFKQEDEVATGKNNNNNQGRNTTGRPVSGNPAINYWKNLGASKSGTCLRLGIDRTPETASAAVPPLILTWKGDDPLDRLHICIKVKLNMKK
jgi:hypothetical protein